MAGAPLKVKDGEYEENSRKTTTIGHGPARPLFYDAEDVREDIHKENRRVTIVTGLR